VASIEIIKEAIFYIGLSVPASPTGQPTSGLPVHRSNHCATADPIG